MTSRWDAVLGETLQQLQRTQAFLDEELGQMASDRPAPRRTGLLAGPLSARDTLRPLLINDLHRALAGRQLRVHYQPVIDLRHGGIHMAEALVRWHHPSLGDIAPSAFLPLAAETGLLETLGGAVLREALRQLARWRDAVPPGFLISVNLRPEQCRAGPGGLSAVPELLRQWGIPGPRLVLEINAGVLDDDAGQLQRALQPLRDAGVRFALEDASHGRLSLDALQAFGPDYLKLAPDFVARLEADSREARLCEAILALADSMGVRVIAGGVERPDQHRLLQSLGCPYSQGFLYSPPIPPSAFETWLQQYTAPA